MKSHVSFRSMWMLPLALALLAPACDSAETGDPELRPLSAAESQMVEAQNTFGLALYQTLAASDPSANLFISPLSVSMAMGMTLNGARGETQDELFATLGEGAPSLAAYNEASASLLAFLSGLDPHVATTLANSIWHEQTFTPEPAFLETNQTYYDASVRALDFAAPASVDTINDWVADKTNDKIETIIQTIPPDAVMYLINAIYFKGDWKYQFNADATLDEPFYAADGSHAPAPLMRMKASVPYQSAETFDAIDLPYGNGQFRMTVVLPHATAELPALIAGLDAEAWDRLVDGFEEAEVSVFLPRFTLRWEDLLNEPLKALGINRAFIEGGADFTGIHATRGHDLFISRVIHKSFVEVNEEGTEAAAVTAVEVSTTSAGPEDELEYYFRADRPFVFAIREAHSGAILFIGTLNQVPAAG